jgi:hypothetical protein
MGNQFMTQLTDKIREAIIGNVGTVVSGRIGITDAEMLVKKFAPTFDAEDLTKMPNYQSVTSVMINNVPSAPFSMSFLPPMGQTNAQLSDALKRLSAAKYGKPRAQVEKDIFTRLGAAEAEKKAKAEEVKKTQQQRMTGMNSGGAGSSFLDEWLAKRRQISPSGAAPTSPAPATAPSASTPITGPVTSSPSAPVATTTTMSVPRAPVASSPSVNSPTDVSNPFIKQPAQPMMPATPEGSDDGLHLRGDKMNHDSEVSIKLR